MTADVTVTPNLNEIRDHKYVSKEELQQMFAEPCKWHKHSRFLTCIFTRHPANSFTPWFKLIARDFLFGWWDELMRRRDANGKVVAKSLAGITDGTKVVKMV